VQVKTISNFVSLFNKFILFLFVFSIYNDVYMVEKIHPNFLKLIFVAFFIININSIYKIFLKKKSNIYYIFTFFILFLIVQTFLQFVFMNDVDIVLFIFYMIILSAIFYFFSNYDNFDLIIYFIWLSIFYSILLCFFANELPIRKTGGTLDPNHFSIEVITFLFLSFYLYAKNQSKIFILFSIIFTVFGILFAMSKAAILVLVITLLYFILIKFKSFRPLDIIKFFLSFILLIFIALQTSFSFQEKLEQFEKRTERNTEGSRIHSFKAGLNMIADNFISGVGFYQFKENKGKYISGYVEGDAPGAHNLYIKLFAESGIIVFFTFMIFLILLLSTDYFKIIKSNYIWIHLAVLSNLIMGMSLSLTYEKDLWLILALLANVVYNRNQFNYKNKKFIQKPSET
jgi:O-antigen ligase